MTALNAAVHSRTEIWGGHGSLDHMESYPEGPTRCFFIRAWPTLQWEPVPGPLPDLHRLFQGISRENSSLITVAQWI